MRLALSATSNPISSWVRDTLPTFLHEIEKAGHSLDERATRLTVTNSRVVPEARAGLLNDLFADDEVDAILDVSGGDLANEVLDLLDYDLIAANPKPFVGYSDVSVVNLALNKLAGLTPTWWHADRILERGTGDLDKILRGERLIPTLNGDGKSPTGPILGGNIRCIAKLAGTRYWPAFENCSVFLEGRSVDLGTAATYLTQLKQAGFFDRADALILGQFTVLDDEGKRETLIELVSEKTDLPIWHAPFVGHSKDAEPMTIG